MPVPKRTEERRRRNATEPVEKAPAGEPIKAPPLPLGMRPLAVSWYESLEKSGQAKFYEASDWAMAQVMAQALNDYLSDPSAAQLRAFLVGAEALLVTDGARRRMRLELIRRQQVPTTPAQPADPGVTPRPRLRAIDGDAVDPDGTAG